ncbi:MAG TPA: LLM class flavin-dependent oxidoreductase [Candidatus Dormibacteraeota bacterium]|nr:LLM class flavin-dependent oxidoreductase [Candidatus Dormibacteraeota bacterium]
MTTPALSFAAVPGRRRATIDLAQEIERRGFAGLYCPSFGDGLALCEALALSTHTIEFGTSIANIYTRHAYDFAQTAAFIHEISGGRFRFGIGVSHAPTNAWLGVQAGKPVADMRRFVGDLRTGAARTGDLPPIVLAALRRRMVALAGELAEGAVWANAARSHMHASLQALPAGARRESFFVGNMIPTCVCDDRAAGAAVMRRALRGYVQLPNYQQYWIEAGYVDEMHAIQQAIAERRMDDILPLMSDRWLNDVTLFGPPARIRDGVAAWRAAGVKTPILVPSSTRGGQMEALNELFAVFE